MEAQNLVQQRDARVVPIADADTFFQEVQSTVDSIVEFSRPHPLSTQAAVETLKRYLVNSEYRIRLADHIDSVVGRLTGGIGEDVFPIHSIVDPVTFTARLEAYESACTTLTAMAVVAGQWAEDCHFQNWNRAIRQVYNRHEVSGQDEWLRLKNYPANLLMYALGLGAVASGRLPFLGRLFDIAVDRRIAGINPSTVLFGLEVDMNVPNWNQLLPGKEKEPTPFNDRLHDVLKIPGNHLLLDHDEYSLVFDTLEILMALNTKSHFRDSWWLPLGAFLHRPINRHRVFSEIKDSLNQFGEASPYVKHGIIGPDFEAGWLGVVEYEAHVISTGQQRGVWQQIIG